LRCTRSAPVCAEIEQYRLALGCKLVEFGRAVRLDLARKRRASGDRQKKQHCNLEEFHEAPFLLFPAAPVTKILDLIMIVSF
jgi:hypothetical protein